MSTTVSVAPREIHDLAYRACCVAGCDAGIAERIAHNVAFAEIHHGGAVRAFCEALETTALPTSAWVTAPDALAAAELAARDRGTASVTFEPPVPLAAIAGTLQQSLERGVASTGADADARAYTTVSAIELRLEAEPNGEAVARAARERSEHERETSGAATGQSANPRRLSADDPAASARLELIDDARANAYRYGIAVEQAWFSRLEAAAAGYLVAESTLDEIDSRPGVA